MPVGSCDISNPGLKPSSSSVVLKFQIINSSEQMSQRFAHKKQNLFLIAVNKESLNYGTATVVLFE